jgi:hypothetical protein
MREIYGALIIAIKTKIKKSLLVMAGSVERIL